MPAPPPPLPVNDRRPTAMADAAGAAEVGLRLSAAVVASSTVALVLGNAGFLVRYFAGPDLGLVGGAGKDRRAGRRGGADDARVLGCLMAANVAVPGAWLLLARSDTAHRSGPGPRARAPGNAPMPLSRNGGRRRDSVLTVEAGEREPTACGRGAGTSRCRRRRT